MRGEFNFGKEPQKGKPGWNIAPFVRYWHINQSNYEGSSNEYVDVSSQEPTNNWVEVGAAFSLLFE